MATAATRESGTVGGTSPGPAGRVLAGALRWLRGVPATWTLLLFTALGPLLPLVDPARPGSLPHAPHEVATSLLFAPHPLAWALALVGVAVLGPPAEREAGSGPFAARVVLGHTASVLAVLGLLWAVRQVDPAWGAVLRSDAIAGPWAGLIVAFLASSGSWDSRWRRRLLTLALPVTAATVLFSGAPEDASLLTAVLLGGWLGRRRARRLGTDAAPVGSRSERRVLVATAVAAVVLGTFLAAGSPHLVGPLAGTRALFAASTVSPDMVAAACADDDRIRECARGTYILTATGPGAVLLAALPLVLQLVLADGLRRGRRAALQGTLVLQSVLAALAAAHLGLAAWAVAAGPRDYPTDPSLITRLILPVLVPLGVLALVLAHRGLFQARAPHGAYRRLRAVPILALAVVAMIVAVGLAVPEQFSPRPGVGALLADGLIALLPSTALTVLTPAALPSGPVARFLLEWLPLVPWLAGIWLLWRAQHPLGGPVAQPGEAAEAARALAAEDATMAWMGTWEGCRLWRSPTHAGAVAYRVHQDVALTVGDPYSSARDRAVVTRQFAEFCVAHSLVPALYSVHPVTAQAVESRGWFGVQVAEEAVIRLGGVTFGGKRFQDLRTARNRAKKEGITARWTTWAEAGDDLRAQIRAISAAWVADKELPEMGFTLGGLAELDDPAVRLLLAEDEDGRLHGVTSWLPVHDAGRLVGLTLDFMRRAEGGFRPVVEFLLAQAVLDAQEEGLALVSLSGAPLARSQPDPSADVAPAQTGALDRLLDQLGHGLEPVYGFRSLHAFKEKFGPESVPLRLCVPDPAELPRVGAALTRAYLPTLTLGDLVRAGQDLRRREG
ncbi:DUF2156 domain-containing protein [Micrococcus porci]|uniref:bifunctional lysylphosphatidylglycerol flippase/synthetase MprF n=1 Tax=Micrococcus TaxID=1269 RepID=UPI001CCABDDD|nr:MULTISPECIES: DUF2156 domain-containing protein [Micrococcus]MCG7422403.1 DUF2156 domain-containing protein [Micrococcus sp. ACRRV]UBH24876.1 DUF2156 domain-containing protein [Micrococcus porci]